MAVPAAPPIFVTCALLGDSEEPAQVPAAHFLVAHTLFLGWRAAAAGVGCVAQVELCTWQMIHVFGSRLQASRLPVDLVASRTAMPLRLKLTGPCWTRVLNEYVVSGLLDIPVQRRHELIEAVGRLTIVNPMQLVITTADWDFGEDTGFQAPVPPVAPILAIPAVPARGAPGRRGYVAGRPALPGVPGRAGTPGRLALDPALDFLTLVDVVELEETGDAPWRLIAYLAGALGACLTQAERNRAASQVQVTARAIAAGCHRRFGSTAGDHHSLALNLKDYLVVLADALPVVFLSPGAEATLLRAEVRDAIVYARDGDGRRSVEEARVHAIANT